MTLYVKNIINSPIAAFHSDGLKVFDELVLAYKRGEKVEMHFREIERFSTQFLNSSIGKMYFHLDPTSVDSLLTYNFGNLPNLEARIKEVRENAINSKEYDALIENATA
jgi:hypothetical protein